MAIAVTKKYDGDVSASYSGNTNWSRTSSSFTPANGSLLVVCAHTLANSSATPVVLTVSGGSLTWTRRVSAYSAQGSYEATAEIWTAPVVTGASMTVTVAIASGTAYGEVSVYSVYEVTGHNTSSPFGVTGSDAGFNSGGGAYSFSLSGTSAASSLVIASAGFSDNSGDPLVNAGSGWTEQYKTWAGNGAFWQNITETRVGALSTATFGSTTSPDRYASVALEIKEAGGGAYELVAGQGGYTISGQTAILKRSLQLIAAQGSYAVNGQAATLAIGRKLIAAQGSYAISGQAAVLAMGRKLIAAQGAYSVNGQDAELLRTYAVAAGTGMYSVAGQPAVLAMGRKLVAAQGAYSVNGQDAVLSRGLKLVAAQGAYAVNGQEATLSVGRKLIAATGTYSINGQAAVLSYSGAPPGFGSSWLAAAMQMMRPARPGAP